MHVYTHDIYIYACSYTHTYTHIHTRIQHIHMHTRNYAWNDSAAATARRADADAGSSAHLFRSTQSASFSTSNARTSLYTLPETPIPLNPPSPLPNIPQNSLQTAASAVLLFHTDQHNRVHNSQRSFVQLHNGPLRSCRKIGGKVWVHRSPLDKHAGCRARECTM